MYLLVEGLKENSQREKSSCKINYEINTYELIFSEKKVIFQSEEDLIKKIEMITATNPYEWSKILKTDSNLLMAYMQIIAAVTVVTSNLVENNKIQTSFENIQKKLIGKILHDKLPPRNYIYFPTLQLQNKLKENINDALHLIEIGRLFKLEILNSSNILYFRPFNTRITKYETGTNSQEIWDDIKKDLLGIIKNG